MIKTHVQAMAMKRGITSAYYLQKALEVQTSVAYRLWSDDFEAIHKASLDKLCRVLKCKPGQLITYEPGEAEDGTEA